MPIPRTIHQIWLGPSVPDEVSEFHETWRHHHPGWEYKLWGDGDFAWLKNVELFNAAGPAAIKADIARLEILCRYGGLYVDSDVECHRSIDTLLGDSDLVLLSEGDLLTNAFIATIPDHPIVQAGVARIGQLSAQSLKVPEWSALPETGPLLLTRVAVELRTVFSPSTRVLPSEVANLPRSQAAEIVRLASERRWMTHHAHASWRSRGSWAYRLRSTRLRTRIRRFWDLSAS